MASTNSETNIKKYDTFVLTSNSQIEVTNALKIETKHNEPSFVKIHHWSLKNEFYHIL